MRSTVVMLLLALLAAATWVATWQPAGPAAPASDNENTSPLGYYVRGARWLGTDEQGRVAYQILAERLDEVPNEDRLRLQGVNVRYHPVDETAWEISAATASAPKDGSQLELSGNVELTSSPPNRSRPTTIVTQHLNFWPDSSRAESDDPVHVLYGDLDLKGGCLRTELKGETLRLECGVNGTFTR
jgi:LPS export ABC transporter protein LptC